MKPEYKMRAIPAEFRAVGDEKDPHIAGYFAVFDSPYIIYPGMEERIDSHAFDNTMARDIRALVNHDTTLVLGRNTAHTLELSVDSHGLFGDIAINPNDSDAMNAYARVQRGDVSQCSIGFDIIDEEPEYREDGSVCWILREIKLYEVSVCTFPAYEETSVSARAREGAELIKRRNQAWGSKLLARLRGDKDNA